MWTVWQFLNEIDAEDMILCQAKGIRELIISDRRTKIYILLVAGCH